MVSSRISSRISSRLVSHSNLQLRHDHHAIPHRRCEENETGPRLSFAQRRGGEPESRTTKSCRD